MQTLEERRGITGIDSYAFAAAMSESEMVFMHNLDRFLQEVSITLRWVSYLGY